MYAYHVNFDSQKEHTRNVKEFANGMIQQRPLSRGKRAFGLTTVGVRNYRRWLSSIESSDVYPKRYGILLVSV
jgi:hypothetical protein